jgi:uncharacterized protein YqeY
MLDKISEDIKTAMRSKDSARLDVLRMMKAKIMNVSTKGVDEKETVKILKTYANNLKDAIEQFTKGGKLEEATQTQSELKIVAEYLPQESSEADILAAIDAAIVSIKPQGSQDIGKLMKAVMASGINADGNTVKNLVSKKLNA